MDTSIQYLIHLLEDEFGKNPEIRIRPTFPAGTMRAPDLPQDYDAEANNVHRTSGVNVMTRTKEYFFPEDWARAKQFSKIHQLVEKIREDL